MADMFRIVLTDFYKFSNGQTCLVGKAEPKEHKVITSKCKAKIVIDGKEFPLNIIGQDLISRTVKTDKNEQTIIRTGDNLDDILNNFEEKQIVVLGYFSD